jgi:hypothetical protein
LFSFSCEALFLFLSSAFLLFPASLFFLFPSSTLFLFAPFGLGFLLRFESRSRFLLGFPSCLLLTS